MLDIKENIEDYLMVYYYASKILGYRYINYIEISNKLVVNVWFLEKTSNGFFKYMEDTKITFNISSDEFNIFKRDYTIGTMLYIPEDDGIYYNDNIAYLRYINMLSKSSSTYTENLKKYLENLKSGSPIYYIGNKAVVNKIHRQTETMDIYVHNSEEVFFNVDFNYIKPRKLTEKKNVTELVTELKDMTTRELIRLKNEHYSGYNEYKQYHKNDILDVLATREHIKRKKRVRQ